MIDTISLQRFQLQLSFKQELHHILNYWQSCSIDKKDGGFYGELTNDNKPVPGAVKGSVLNSRILWAFSAAYRLTNQAEYLEIAGRAFNYICDHFIDREFGGVYWSVAADGAPLDAKKQIYALAFAIYGLSEYNRVTGNSEALQLAQSLYRDIEKHSFDQQYGGYFEALTRDWQPIGDLRLSDKDANEKKTMNTHLHILEAYTNLYRVWPDVDLRLQIRALLRDFEDHIVNKKNHHLNLFFDELWYVKSGMISYGHDIEASWLLLEAAEMLGDEDLIERIKHLAIEMAMASAEGLNTDGSMSYEFEPGHNKLITEKHWWVQAEAIVGFYNAYQLTGDQSYLDKVLALWQFTQRHIIDRKHGEWFWGINADGKVMEGYGKVGFWKCPYHNSRACMEMMTRLENKI
jgi:cellobiose epimerase